MAEPASRLPIGIIGTGTAPPGSDAYVAAQEVAFGLARRGLVIACGGRGGVMEAACKGAHEGGGISIGILPHPDLAEANPYATILLPTDLGAVHDPICRQPEVSRNRVIASAAFCLVAIGGGAGTANEIKHALDFGKTVFGICGAPEPEENASAAAKPSGGTYIRLDSARAAIAQVADML